MGKIKGNNNAGTSAMPLKKWAGTNAHYCSKVPTPSLMMFRIWVRLLL